MPGIVKDAFAQQFSHDDARLDQLFITELDDGSVQILSQRTERGRPGSLTQLSFEAENLDRIINFFADLQSRRAASAA